MKKTPPLSKAARALRLLLVGRGERAAAFKRWNISRQALWLYLTGRSRPLGDIREAISKDYPSIDIGDWDKARDDV